MSNTQEINAVSISSPWNSTADGDAATPRLFETEGYIDDFLAGMQAYTPAVNTIRVDIDQVTLRDATFQDFLTKSAAAGYQLILNFTDPNFQERDGVSAEYVQTNTADLLGANDGRDIELDEQFEVDGDQIHGVAVDEWGVASAEYDPLDYLADSWQEILDWLARPENAAVAEAVYGYELVNEPSAYENTVDGGLMYYEDMAELFGRVDGWGDAKILVGGLMYSARFSKLAESADGQDATTLDLFRETFGEQLVWSAHYYTGQNGDANADSADAIALPERLSYLGDDDIIVTEMNFDSDFNDSEMERFITASGDIPMWAGWTLLQPIFSGQTDKYYYARLAEELESSGIGMTWWSPIDIDGNLLTVNGSGSNMIQEERDAIAFALNMWMGNDSVDEGGNHGDSEKIEISDEAEGENMTASRTVFGYGGDDTIVGTDTSEYEGLNRYNRTRDYTGNSADADNALTENNDFMGDKAYGGTGNDTILLLGGDDFGFGNDGNDLVSGYTGHDVLVGGAGHDTLRGGDGDDVLEGGDGDDLLLGGDGSDLLIGGEGADVLRAGKGEDYIRDEAGADTIYAGMGDDKIEITEGGNDGQVIYGRGGADVFILAAGTNGLIADFDEDEDVIDLTAWGTNDLDQLDMIQQDDGIWLVAQGEASVLIANGGEELRSEYFAFVDVVDVAMFDGHHADGGLCS